MNDIHTELDANKRGSFYLEQDGSRLAHMEIGIQGSNLTVYHTEVSDKLHGQGIATKLLDYMTDYARLHKLKVIPLCAFVSAQFKRHPEKYADIWNREWHQGV